MTIFKKEKTKGEKFFIHFLEMSSVLLFLLKNSLTLSHIGLLIYKISPVISKFFKELRSNPLPALPSTPTLTSSSSENEPIELELRKFIINGKEIWSFDDIQPIVKINFFRVLYGMYLASHKLVQGPCDKVEFIKFDEQGFSGSLFVGGMRKVLIFGPEEDLNNDNQGGVELFRGIRNFYSGTFDGQTLTVCGRKEKVDSYTFDQLKKEYAREVYPLLLLARDDPTSLLSSDYFPLDMIKLILPRFEL